MVAAIMTRVLFAVSATLWLAVALLIAAGWFDIGPVSPGVVALIVVMMLLAAVVFGLLALRVLRGNRLVDRLAVAVAVVNVALTFTDEVGIYDVAYLLPSVALLLSLVLALRSPHKTGTPA